MMDFFSNFWGWLTGGIYDLLTSFVAYVVTWIITSWYEYLIWQLQFAWAISSKVISNLGFTNQISAAISALPETISSMLHFFQVPRALNIVGHALVSRFVLKLLGWK